MTTQTNTEPLASRLRPKDLDHFIGQSHLVGVNKPLRIAIEKQHLFSMVFWGPPGVGKTTLARIYAKALDAVFFEISAVSAGKDDVRRIIDQANTSSRPTILFIDEIHRFNKAQQDFLLPFVETGTLTLIGATTENPSFEIISPLLSRCRVFVLSELTSEEMLTVITSALKELKVKAKQDAIDWLIAMSNGDARQCLTMLENTNRLYQKITVDTLKDTLQSKHLRFDKQGEEHYNTISAFIKSMRASQVDAALYYMARLVYSGEDPLFVARRMVIFASEDIGLAQPTALVVANEVFRACEIIGLPECQYNLAHGVAYLCNAPKNRSAGDAYYAALDDVKKFGNLPVPLHIRNAPTKFMKGLGYGKGYQAYTDESYLPQEIKNKKYFKK